MEEIKKMIELERQLAEKQKRTGLSAIETVKHQELCETISDYLDNTSPPYSSCLGRLV